MASTIAKELLNQTVNAAIAAEVGCKKQLLAGDVDFKAFIKVTDSSSPVFTMKIQHSPNGVDWEDLATFSATSADGIESIDLDNTTTHVFEHVRAITSAYTSGSATVLIQLFHDRRAVK